MITFLEFLNEGASFELAGKKYSSAFGRYKCDGRTITKDEYAKASAEYKASKQGVKKAPTAPQKEKPVKTHARYDGTAVDSKGDSSIHWEDKGPRFEIHTKDGGTSIRGFDSKKIVQRALGWYKEDEKKPTEEGFRKFFEKKVVSQFKDILNKEAKYKDEADWMLKQFKSHFDDYIELNFDDM